MGGRYFFDWSSYWTMLRLARAESDPRRRRSLYRTFLVIVPTMATVHAVCFALDPLLFPALRRTEVRRPVFSVGHARSGTTFLHRMMAKDPQFSYVLLYEMFFPSLLEKRLLRLILKLDATVGGPLRKRIDAAEERSFGQMRDIHDTGFFEPEEDDFLLTLSLCSGYWMTLFPYVGQLDFYYVDQWSQRKRERMMAFYKECLRRQLVLNGGGTHLSKNPTFCGRVEALIETFPDARFIVPVRNPYETIPSLLKMLQTMWTLRDSDQDLVNDSLREIAEQSFHSYRHPLDVLAAHPDTRSCVVDYRDLVADPATTLRRVYDSLDLELSPAAAEAFDAQIKNPHASSHRYDLEEFGLDRDEIRLRLADLFAEYDWKEDDVVVDSASAG